MGKQLHTFYSKKLNVSKTNCIKIKRHKRSKSTNYNLQREGKKQTTPTQPPNKKKQTHTTQESKINYLRNICCFQETQSCHTCMFQKSPN